LQYFHIFQILETSWIFFHSRFWYFVCARTWNVSHACFSCLNTTHGPTERSVRYFISWTLEVWTKHFSMQICGSGRQRDWVTNSTK
jgi:hypothetical protein